jgi:hypothetical protein
VAVIKVERDGPSLCVGLSDIDRGINNSKFMSHPSFGCKRGTLVSGYADLSILIMITASGVEGHAILLRVLP